MELSGKIEGSVRDILPLLMRIWEWTTAHYLEVMGFIVLLALLAVLRRRRA